MTLAPPHPTLCRVLPRKIAPTTVGADFKVDAVHNLPGFADAADAPSGNTLWITHAVNDTKWHADFLGISSGNYDGLGNARWLIGLTGGSQQNQAMLTKASGENVGTYLLLETNFDDPSVKPSDGNNWGAAFNYYDNLIFAANDGAGVFLAQIDVSEAAQNRQADASTVGTVYMSRVGLSDPTTLNDGGNCGPPALIPFASCQARQGPLTAATTQADCGAGWLVDTDSNQVCSFDPSRGLGCFTGADDAADQKKCCNRDCSSSCNDRGFGFADDWDAGCWCVCHSGYEGGSCETCSAGFINWPNCVLSDAPTQNPTQNPTQDPTKNPTKNPTNAPTVSPDLVIDSVTKREGAYATLTVTLARVHDLQVAVDWVTSDGLGSTGARSPGDYIADSGTVTIAPGSLTATIRIATNEDVDHAEPTEQFSVVLSNAVNAHIAVNPGLVTILNIPAVSVGDAAVDEGSIATVTITRSAAVNFRSTVEWATGDGTAIASADYTAATGTATFNAGETSVDILVVTRSDALNEGPEALFITLSNPDNAHIGRNPGTITITDAALVSVGDAAVPEGGMAQLTVTLSKPSPHSASVDWATADVVAVQPGDYTRATGTIVFAPGQNSISFYVQTNVDNTEEGDETFNVVLSNAVNVAIDDGIGVVSIIDIPSISIADVVIQEGQGADVAVLLNHACSVPVTVQWADAPATATVIGGDYDADNGLLTWQPGDLVINIHMETSLDNNPEGDEQFLITLSGAAAAGTRTSTSFCTVSHGFPCPALHCCSRAVRRALLGGHACGMLIGACDPTL